MRGVVCDLGVVNFSVCNSVKYYFVSYGTSGLINRLWTHYVKLHFKTMQWLMSADWC